MSKFFNYNNTFSTTLSIDDLSLYISGQVNSIFPDSSIAEKKILIPFVSKALLRLEFCFTHMSIKGGRYKDLPCYSHLNTDQHAVFLYYLSHEIYSENGPEHLVEKIYCLNKLLHGIDIFYEIKMPDIFTLVHPVGTVLGRASYSDYFCAYQNVSVGSDLEGNRPSFGKGVVMFGGSRVIGNSIVGDNCFISLGSSVISETIPSNSLVFGNSPDLIIKKTKRNVLRDIFKLKGIRD